MALLSHVLGMTIEYIFQANEMNLTSSHTFDQSRKSTYGYIVLHSTEMFRSTSFVSQELRG